MPRLVQLAAEVWYDLDPDSPVLRITENASNNAVITHKDTAIADYTVTKVSAQQVAQKIANA